MGGTAVRENGQHMKMIAVLVNGVPIFLEKDYMIEKGLITQKQADIYKANLQHQIVADKFDK